MSQHDPLPARPYVSVHLVIVKDGQMLLMQRQNCVDHNGKYVFVAGKVDEGESPTMTAVREAYEEIGITVDPKDVKPLGMIYRAATPYKDLKVDIVEMFMLIDAWKDEPRICEPDKCSDLKFFPCGEMPDNTSKSVEAFLKEKTFGYVDVLAEDWDHCISKPLAAMI